MPAISSSAPGKAILLGEHAVVYGQPAIAIPVMQLTARAVVMAAPDKPTGWIWFDAPDISMHASLSDLPLLHPFSIMVDNLKGVLGVEILPAMRIRITSTIPIAAGLGSGAAITVALLRSISGFIGAQLSDEQVSTIAYQVDKSYHGTPSGIDNTVITYARPIFFVRDQPFELLQVKKPFQIIIADSGIKSRTIDVVTHVREQWQIDNLIYESLFQQVGQLSQAGRQAIQNGRLTDLGTIMNENHALLQAMGVSSLPLDQLVSAARGAGALGAKLSGAGWGGNVIALVTPDLAEIVSQALLDAGTIRCFRTEIKPDHGEEY